MIRILAFVENKYFLKGWKWWERSARFKISAILFISEYNTAKHTIYYYVNIRQTAEIISIKEKNHMLDKFQETVIT